MKGRINKKVSCFLVGEDSMADRCMKAILESGYDLLGVCSPTENVVAFAEQKGIPHTNSLQVLKDRMRETECDFLFSISNTRILDKELIELPRVFSINYHNAPLPKYAGVHATSQAILNDERVHGATWHVIEEGVDTGDILKQVIVDVDNEDTNFTLDMKCMEKSISSFRELLDELKNGTYTKTKQDMSLRSYYTMYQKPENFAVISGEFSAQDVYRIYRATSFLGYANRMTLPKFVIKDLVFFAQKIDILDKKGRYPAGTLVEISKDYLRISTKTNDIALSHLRNFNNVEYSAQEFAEMYNLREGDQLTSFDPDFLRRLREQAELLAKHEPFWVRVLEKVVGLNFWIPTSPGAKTSFFREITVFSEDLLEKLSLLFENADARTILETLLLVYLYRLNGCENYSLGYRTKYRGAEKTDVFFEDTVPMNVVFTPETDFEQALVFVADLFGKTDSRLTFSRDITLRYPQLTDHTTPLPIAVGTVRPEKFDADLFFEIKDRSIIVHTCDKLNEIGHRIVENIFGHLQTMVEGLLLDRSVPIKEIPLLTEREKKVFSDVYNNTKTEYPRDLSVSQIFEQQVELYPNNVAVKHLKESLTYDELNQKANQLASYLIDLGVKKGSLVATFFNKGVNSIMSILAITKAGATYTPIDPMYPREHIKYILQDTGALIVLSQEKDKYVLEECLPSGKFIIISVDSQSIKTRIFNNDNKENRNAVGSVRATDMAYIMYTSGSSGVPKGVCIPHRGIVRLIKNTNYIEVDSSDIVSQVASISFDASVFEVWTALLNGAALVCADNGVITDVDAFSEFLKQEKITVLTMVSALFEQHASADPSMFRRVKYLHVGGDVLNADAISKVMNCESGSPKFILNGYGPTENTNCTTVYSIPKDFDKTRPIPIGKPVSNTTVFVLDKFLNPVPECIPGELCTGGDGLFIGYLNKDELTGEKLISLKNGEKVYKSGDLVRWLPDGNIDYMCRLDTQAKIRGFRIELEAIELCLMNCHAVNQCAVVIKQDKNAKKTLVAYVVLKDKYKDAITVMKDFLRMYLPHYMIPNLFIIMESLPVTPNGKIDKKKLLQNFQEQSQKSVDYVLPRNKLESDLAEIWKELLGLSSVSINDNFFDLGGYSLLLTEMAVKIKKQLDIAFPLHLFLESPTLINLARIIESKKMNSQSTFRDVKSTFFHDIFLDPRISYLPDSPFPTEQKTIFITGATGFLGIHLLNDVYRMSDAKIYCLVRGKDVEEAEEKLRRSANKYHLNKAVVADKNRVIAVPGDLSKPNLGISPDTYEMLCETADCILHCGAQVHHLYNYEMLRADNVAGTLEIMAIASRGKNKHVHFVSTLSAVVGSSSDKIIEDFPSENDFVPGEMSGYAQTKLASEIILGKALKRDMSVFVYRPTWIIGNNDSGAFASENNHLFLLLKGCLQLGSAPILDAKLNLIPVDVVSSFIVKTALDSSNKKRVFNMINPHDTEWNDVIDRLNGCGYEIEPVSPLIWQKEYLPAVDEWNALYPLMPLYFDGGVEWASMQNIPCQRDGGDAILDHGSLELSPEKVMSNVIRICSVFFGRQGFA